MATTFMETLATYDSSVIPLEVVLIAPVALLVKHFDGCVRPLLPVLFSVPHVNEEDMEVFDDDGFVVIDFEHLGRKGGVAG